MTGSPADNAPRGAVTIELSEDEAAWRAGPSHGPRI